MPIEYREREDGGPKVVMISCPVCGRDLRDQRKTAYHVAGHDPQDFGLSAAGVIPDDHDDPTGAISGRVTP